MLLFVFRLYYKKKSDFPLKPQLVFGNGDGTVNIRSLRGCLRWAEGDPRLLKRRKSLGKENGRRKKKKQKNSPVYHVEFPGVDHMTILKDSQVINYIRRIVGNMNVEK
jgi:lysophospholipase-3